jgi:hypothetical protein
MPSLTSGRGLRRNAQIAGRRDLEAGAEREAVDAGDHRDLQLARRVTAAMHPGDEPPSGRGVDRRHLVDVGAADEGPIAGAGQHHAAQCLVARELLERRHEVRHQRTVERVELAGIVDRHMGDTGAALALVDARDDATALPSHSDPLVAAPRRGKRCSIPCCACP